MFAPPIFGVTAHRRPGPTASFSSSAAVAGAPRAAAASLRHRELKPFKGSRSKRPAPYGVPSTRRLQAIGVAAAAACVQGSRRCTHFGPIVGGRTDIVAVDADQALRFGLAEQLHGPTAWYRFPREQFDGRIGDRCSRQPPSLRRGRGARFEGASTRLPWALRLQQHEAAEKRVVFIGYRPPHYPASRTSLSSSSLPIADRPAVSQTGACTPYPAGKSWAYSRCWIWRLASWHDQRRSPRSEGRHERRPDRQEDRRQQSHKNEDYCAREGLLCTKYVRVAANFAHARG